MAKSTKPTSLASIPGTLVLVGAGKMGGAMLEGWLARNGTPTANASRIQLADGRQLFAGSAPEGAAAPPG